MGAAPRPRACRPRAAELRLLAAFCVWPLAFGGRGNCGVEIPYSPGAPDDAYFTLQAGGEETDLEDLLCGGLTNREYREALKNCEGGDSARCSTYGIPWGEWHLNYWSALVASSVKERSALVPCQEDQTAWPGGKCGDSVACQKVDGEVRIVGVQTRLGRTALQQMAGLPHLLGVQLHDIGGEDLADLSLPDTVRIVQWSHSSERWAEQLLPLMRAQGKVTSVGIKGQQNIPRWRKFDLSGLCGLPLVRFSAFVLDVGGIPECWSGMTSLRSFYCTNCMMTTVPTALRGMTQLQVFVAFRQSEMIPCALKEVPRDPSRCKASWETRFKFKTDGRSLESTGAWSDFQEGPSFLCQESAYAFPFASILDLGWTGIQKVWLDGNFLTGEIPDRIAEVWPSLKSLDLYDNSMEGPIPESLGRLRMVKLQLQANNFNGTVPPALFRADEYPLVLGLSDNPELGGCVPADFQHTGGGVAGTRMQPCDREEL